MEVDGETALWPSAPYEFVAYEPPRPKAPRNTVSDTTTESNTAVSNSIATITDLVVPEPLPAAERPRSRPVKKPNSPKPNANARALRPLTGYFLALSNVVNRPREGEKRKVQASQRLRETTEGE